MKILFSTIVMVGALSVLTLESAAKDKKPKATPVSCGATISAPGNYFLSGDCTGAGIKISASNVTLDLKRHTLTGTSPGSGIDVFNVSRVNITGPGTITNYTFGVFFTNVRNSVVENLSVKATLKGIILRNSSGNEIRENQANNHLFTGIELFGCTDNEIEENELTGNGLGILLNNSSGNEIKENETNGNESVGIELDNGSNDNEVKDNEANGNERGIYLDNGCVDNEIEENTALNNAFGDLFDQNLNCDNNAWEDNTFNTANKPCID